jgi:DUF1680 family protein
MTARHEVSVPPAIGHRYMAEIPDTLDLAERARSAINVLTRAIAPEPWYYASFQVMELGTNPPHFAWPNWLNYKWLEALARMRLMSGDELNLDIEHAMMQSLVDRIGSLGLLYHPPTSPCHPPDAASPFASGRMMLTMAAWHERDGDPAWLELIREMGHGLDEIAIRRHDYAYYPLESGYTAQGDWIFTRRGAGRPDFFPYTPPEEPAREQAGHEGTVKFDVAVPIRGLVKGYQLTGDERAIDAARRLAKFCLLPTMWQDGWEYGISGHQHGMWAGHFHGNVMALRGLLDLAVTTGDQKLKDIVREAYEHGRRAGLARVGWFPGWITPERFGRIERLGDWVKKVAETCAIADMLALAVALSDAGIGDFWDDVDHFVRNQLVEQQLVDGERLQSIVEQAAATLPRREITPAVVAGLAGQEIAADLGATADVIERTVGGFGMGTPSGIAPVDVTSIGGVGSVAAYGCCTGNGSLGLYDAWEGIVRFRDGLATVNLLLNRASPWVDVASSLPCEGRVRITNKLAHAVAVRVPGWADIGAVQLSVDGTTVNPNRVGRYLVVEELKPGQVLALRFDVPEERVEYTAHYQPYNFVLRGSTVLDVEPRLESELAYPFYRREHIHTGPAPIVVRERFVAD